MCVRPHIECVCVCRVLTLWSVKSVRIPVCCLSFHFCKRFRVNECNVCACALQFSVSIVVCFWFAFSFHRTHTLKSVLIVFVYFFAAHLPVVVLNLFLFPFRHMHALTRTHTQPTSIHHRFIRFEATGERHTHTHNRMVQEW